MRAEATDLTGPGAPKTVVYLYLSKDDRIVPVDPPTGPVVSAGTIAVVEERARAAGHRRRPGGFAATPLHSTQSFGKWTCEAWAVRRAGQTTEIVCLADPNALGVDTATRANLRKMNAHFVRFLNAARLATGDLREGFDAYTLEGGLPVRTFRSKDGVVEMDAQLVSVENADLSPDLFRAPEPPASAATPPPRAAAPAPDRSITLEGWALRGMPDPGRPWTGADYDAAAGLLESVAKEGAARLPRGTSANSGPLFRRLVDPENLAPLQGAGAVDARAKAGAGILAGVDRISVVYATAYRDDGAFGAELAALMSYTLLVSHETVPLADSLLAAPKKREKSKDRYEREARRAKLSDALAAIVSGCLESLAAPGGFRPVERRSLASAVEAHLPALATRLPAAARRDLPGRLKKMSASESDPAVKDALDRTCAAFARPAPKAH
ncbi:MAG: hypothetical protein IPL89_17535 [Acidobacteria bacterium]|nr:hypothetical protein [Acidobacteriota bacterium]